MKLHFNLTDNHSKESHETPNHHAATNREWVHPPEAVKERRRSDFKHCTPALVNSISLSLLADHLVLQCKEAHGIAAHIIQGCAILQAGHAWSSAAVVIVLVHTGPSFDFWRPRPIAFKGEAFFFFYSSCGLRVGLRCCWAEEDWYRLVWLIVWELGWFVVVSGGLALKLCWEEYPFEASGLKLEWGMNGI